MLGIFITAGYPNYKESLEALKFLDTETSVELIELGVPFSDPLADGPTIQKASYEALQQGMNLDKVFELVNEAKLRTKTILFSYFNPLYSYGFEKLIKSCKESGLSGVLIPDLPVEEAEKYSVMFKNAGLDMILLASITSSEERLKKIVKHSHPWIYLVARIGITGSEQEISSLKLTNKQSNYSLRETLSQLKKLSNKKIGIGFGIDSREKVEETLRLGADMAIIGSKAIKEQEKGLDSFKEFISSLQDIEKISTVQS
jgi:tryptophan synthase alpha chain